MKSHWATVGIAFLADRGHKLLFLILKILRHSFPHLFLYNKAQMGEEFTGKDYKV